MAIIGIDLGTTNSLCAIWENGAAKLIVNANGNHQTPSVVGFDDDGQIIVGEAAKQRLLSHPDKTTSCFKRFMGSNRDVKIGSKKFRAEELSALVLKVLKHDAEAYLGEEVTSAVISVPAYFNDSQRKATKHAGALAGLEVKRLINEPTAAAIAYGLHEQEDDSTFLICDIGGGTFDVSILELFDGVMQVHATAGDNFLGGEDFAQVLMSDFAQKNGFRLENLNGKQLAKLKSLTESCKLELSAKVEAKLSMEINGFPNEATYTRAEFNKIIAPLIQRLKAPLERALKDSKIHASELDAVVMVGGASRTPEIRSMTAKLLGQIPAINVNPDEVIALGTAVQAGLIENDSALNEVVLTDVSSFTLGVDVVNENTFESNNNLFHPIIDRNSPVPISKMDVLTTASDNQTEVRIGIYQGESRLAKDNVYLGELTVKVPRGPRGKEVTEVRFTYDINGLLEVEAKVQSTGVTKCIVIEGNPGVMTEKEIQKRLTALSELKIHPREKLANTTVIARGERLYQESLGELREYIGDILKRFDEILHRQNPKEIEEAVVDVNRIFDELESQSPF